MRTLGARREAAELSGASETTVKKAVDQRVIPIRRRGSQSCVEAEAKAEAEDVPVPAMLGLLSEMRIVVRQKRRLRAWLRASTAAAELELAPALVVRRVYEIEQARVRAERYTRLRDQWIVRDSEIEDGEPAIRGSRVSVHTLADRIARTGATPWASEARGVYAVPTPHAAARSVIGWMVTGAQVAGESAADVMINKIVEVRDDGTCTWRGVQRVEPVDRAKRVLAAGARPSGMAGRRISLNAARELRLERHPGHRRTHLLLANCEAVPPSSSRPLFAIARVRNGAASRCSNAPGRGSVDVLDNRGDG